MTRSLQKIGNSQGLILTRLMLDHLGVTEDKVELRMEDNQIIITAPSKPSPRRRQTFEEAKESTFAQYDVALQRLADM